MVHETHPMKTVPAGEFKQKCLRLLDEVAQTGTPIVITKRGKPVAQVVAPPPREVGAGWLGSLRGTAEVRGDLIEPAIEADAWEALR